MNSKIIGFVETESRETPSYLAMMKTFAEEMIDFRKAKEYTLTLASASEGENEYSMFVLFTENRELADAFLGFWQTFVQTSKAHDFAGIELMSDRIYLEILKDVLPAGKIRIHEVKEADLFCNLVEEDQYLYEGIEKSGDWVLPTNFETTTKHFVLELTLEDIQQAKQKLNSVELLGEIFSK